MTGSKNIENILTEIEKRKDIENWKTTKEVAGVFGVSPISLRRFKSEHPDMFKGLTMRSVVEREGKRREHLLWCPEAIKILGLNISNPHVDQWKEDVIEEAIETGVVITNSALTKPENTLKLIKLQSQQIQTQSQQIIMMVDEIQKVKSDVKELQEKSKNVYVLPRTRKTLRDEVHRVAIEYNNGNHWEVWVPLREKYGISSYQEITEENAQKELELLNQKYPPKKERKQLDYFQ